MATVLVFISLADACLRCQAENKQEDCVGKDITWGFESAWLYQYWHADKCVRVSVLVFVVSKVLYQTVSVRDH